MQRRDKPLQLSLIAAVLTALLALAALIAPLPNAASAAAERTIVLDARMFAYAPGRLRVNQGDRLTLTLQSSDVVHGLYIDGYGVDIQAQPGQPAETTFVADRLGKFKFRCSVSCGAMHPFMIGELVVGPNIPFWRAVAALFMVTVGSMVTVSLSQRSGEWRVESAERRSHPRTSSPPPSTLHPPPSTLHPPPSTLHPPPSHDTHSTT